MPIAQPSVSAIEKLGVLEFVESTARRRPRTCALCLLVVQFGIPKGVLQFQEGKGLHTFIVVTHLLYPMGIATARCDLEILAHWRRCRRIGVTASNTQVGRVFAECRDVKLFPPLVAPKLV